MKTVRIMTLGFLLTGAIACVSVNAQNAPPRPPQESGNGPFPEYSSPAQPFNQPPGPMGGPGWYVQDQTNSDSRQLAQKYVKTQGEEEKAGIRKKLHEAVVRDYDHHVKTQQAELDSLEKKITKLRGVAKKRADAKSTIVNQRIDQLVQEASGLGWTPGSPVSAPYANWAPLHNQSNAEDVSQLAMKYAKAEGDDEKKDIRKKLTETVGQQFDEHMKAQEKQLVALEKQVAGVKATMRKRSDAKSAIVERRIEQLLYEADGLGWAGGESNNIYHSYLRSRISDPLTVGQ